MKQTLYEDNLISEAIQEEMGISDEVDSLALLLSNTVLNNIKRIPRSKVAPGISISTFKIPLKSGFGQGLVVKVVNTFFGDKEIYAEYRLQTPKKANIYKKKDNTLEMHIDYINEMPNSENFYGAFYHELKHLFQDVKSFGQIKNRPNYQTSAWGIRHENETIRTVSEIVYYGTDKELRAFTGQAYEGLMHMDIFNSPYSEVRDAIIDTKLYQGYLKLKGALTFLQRLRRESPRRSLVG